MSDRSATYVWQMPPAASISFCVAARADDDFAAGAGDLERSRLADARRAAGDDDDLSLDLAR
jgi:hypothetical protein